MDNNALLLKHYKLTPKSIAQKDNIIISSAFNLISYIELLQNNFIYFIVRKALSSAKVELYSLSSESPLSPTLLSCNKEVSCQ